MAKRVLTDTEYGILAHKLLGHDADISQVNQCKQVHRLLAEGRKPEELTPLEQVYAAAFKGARFCQIPNDYGWEPGIEFEDAPAEKQHAKPNGKKKG